MSGRDIRVRPPRLIAYVETHCSAVDPGFVRTRRGLQCVGACAATWITVSAITSLNGIPSIFRIALFGAGTCLFGALLIADPRPRDRIRTSGWASIITAVAVGLTVYLGEIAVWAVAAFLVTQMFLSFTLRAWSVRAGSLAAIGGLTTFVVSGGHITTDRIVWFITASTIGFAWLTIWQRVILPDRPANSARRALHVLDQLAADVVARAALSTNPENAAPLPTALRNSLTRVTACRKMVDAQLAVLSPDVVQVAPVDELRVTIYSMQTALERLVDHIDHSQWNTTVGYGHASSLSAILNDLAEALTVPTDSAAMGEVTAEVQRLRVDLDACSVGPATDAERQPGHAKLTVAATLDAADLIIESVSHAASLKISIRGVGTKTVLPVRPIEHPVPPPRIWGLRPTTALGVQAVVASISAGLIALWVGIEQSRVVAYTAFLVIGASAGTSLRRAWTRVAATAIGAVVGVLIAASVPRNPSCIGVVFVVGVFFTVFTAPVSNAAMVFWLSIATVPLAATEGSYLDLVKDKTLAALIAGCVAAVVVLTVAPIRLSESLRPAMLTYLDALDHALGALTPVHGDRDVKAAAELDRAHTALDAVASSAAAEIHLFAQSRDSPTEQRMRIDAVHEAYLRLAPLFQDSAVRILGWTAKDIDDVVRKLRADVEIARSSLRGDPAGGPKNTSSLQFPWAAGVDHLELTDQRRRIDSLHLALTELARACTNTDAQ